MPEAPACQILSGRDPPLAENLFSPLRLWEINFQVRKMVRNSGTKLRYYFVKLLRLIVRKITKIYLDCKKTDFL